jgi:hypothetical protein
MDDTGALEPALVARLDASHLALHVAEVPREGHPAAQFLERTFDAPPSTKNYPAVA